MKWHCHLNDTDEKNCDKIHGKSREYHEQRERESRINGPDLFYIATLGKNLRPAPSYSSPHY